MDYQNYLNKDFKSYQQPTEKRRGRHSIHAAVVIAVLAGTIGLFSPSHDAEATREIVPVAEEQAPAAAIPTTFELALPEAGQAAAPIIEQLEEEPKWHTVTVKNGDTLAAIFQKLKLSPQTLYATVNAGQEAKALKRLMPGQELRFQLDESQGLAALHYNIDKTKTLAINREGDSYQAAIMDHPIEIRQTHAAATIENSLYLAGQKAGLSDNIIMELANIFGWDIDFALDIRSGDSFTLVYEEQYLNGEKLRDGSILAAEFINQGHSYRAVRFTDEQGRANYFTPDGLSMRKAFLRSPVDFRRISSRFTRERYHPVLGKKRPHRGVDYAAKTGTPIKASGDGKVIFRGTKGGYGRTIILQHGGRYTTLYAHLSKYRGSVRTGSRVKQGQIIGYVGKSGMATGPHLHYEFRVNGAHRNPLTVKLPNAAPIPKQYVAAFKEQSQQLLGQLDTLKTTALALAEPPL